MMWLFLACMSRDDPEPPRPPGVPSCGLKECLDEWLFSDVPFAYRWGIGELTMNWHRDGATPAQKKRLLELATPPAAWEDARLVIEASRPTDVVFVDQVVRTSINPEQADLAVVCAGSSLIHDETLNPYCYGVFVMYAACRVSKGPVCDAYQDLNMDWFESMAEPEPVVEPKLKRADD